MTTLFGRRVILTRLDPIPRAFRCAPGVIAANQRELDALRDNDGEVFKELAEIVKAEDAAEVRQVYRYPKARRRKHAKT